VAQLEAVLARRLAEHHSVQLERASPVQLVAPARQVGAGAAVRHVAGAGLKSGKIKLKQNFFLIFLIFIYSYFIDLKRTKKIKNILYDFFIISLKFISNKLLRILYLY
jgi:hypothetical protein